MYLALDGGGRAPRVPRCLNCRVCNSAASLCGPERRIVCAMKQSKINILRRSCSAWLMIAAAPLVGAQTPSPAPTAPPAAVPAPETAAAPNADQTGYLFGLK